MLALALAPSERVLLAEAQGMGEALGVEEAQSDVLALALGEALSSGAAEAEWE